MTLRRRIRALGVEIEGGWDTQPPAPIKADGSVHLSASYRCGEVASPRLRSLRSALRWMGENYPQRTASCCGIHVHMSFRDIPGQTSHVHAVSLLSDTREFLDSLLDRLRDWGTLQKVWHGSPFWTRLRGENHYCRTVWDPEGRDRYRAVNFRALERHGTIEVRVLPTFKQVELAQDAVAVVVNTTEAYLAARAALVRDLPPLAVVEDDIPPAYRNGVSVDVEPL